MSVVSMHMLTGYISVFPYREMKPPVLLFQIPAPASRRTKDYRGLQDLRYDVSLIVLRHANACSAGNCASAEVRIQYMTWQVPLSMYHCVAGCVITPGLETFYMFKSCLFSCLYTDLPN